MSDASDFDFPMSRTFREALPAAKDYHVSPTFSRADRRHSPRGASLRAYNHEMEALRRENQELRREVKDCQRRTSIAEAELRDLRFRDPSGGPSHRYEGPEVPA